MSRRNSKWAEAIRANWSGRGNRSVSTHFVASVEPLETRQMFNAAPVVTLFSPTPTTDEDTTFTSTAGNHVSIADSDAGAGDIETLTVHVTGGKAKLGTLAGLTGSGDNSADFTYSGTLAALNDALLGMQYFPTANFNGTATIDFDVNDNGNGGATTPMHGTAGATINVTSVNDFPTMTISTTALSLLSTSGEVTIPKYATNITAGPPDESGQGLTMTVTFVNGSGLFTTQPTLSVDGTLHLVVKPGALGTATVGYMLKDNGPNTPGILLQRNITVSATNAMPTNTVPTATLEFEQNQPYLFSPGDVSVADTDSGGFSETITLTATHGTLHFASAVGSGNGTSTLTYTAPLTSLNAALSGLVFTPATDYAGPATITLSTDDLVHSGATTDSTIDLDVMASAALFLGGGNNVNNSAFYQGTPVPIAPSASIVDGSEPGIIRLVATVGSPQAGDTLAVDVAVLAAHPGISMTGNNTSSVTLTGSATAADYQAVLQSIKYQSTDVHGPTAARQVNVVITDPALNDVAATTTVTLAYSTVVSSRLLFYKGSVRYDSAGKAWAPLPFSHDNAIAQDKIAYLPNGSTATFSNVSSYDRGINGVMVDLAGFHGSISASDFIFRVGNNNTPGSWATAPPVVTILERLGAGAGGSDRIELIWNDNDIKGIGGVGKWLEVIVKGHDAQGGFNENTGLAASDIFFFGSSVGDTGLNDTVAAVVDNAVDELHVRNNPKNLFNNIPIVNIDDFDRDGQVTITDQLLARNNTNNNLNATKFIKIAQGAAAPEVVAAASTAISQTQQIDVGVASGLAAGGGAWKLVDAPAVAWLNQRLHTVDVGAAKPTHDRLIAWFEHLAKELPHARKRAAADDALADVEGVCDDLLESLLAGRKT